MTQTLIHYRDSLGWELLFFNMNVIEGCVESCTTEKVMIEASLSWVGGECYNSQLNPKWHVTHWARVCKKFEIVITGRYKVHKKWQLQQRSERGVGSSWRRGVVLKSLSDTDRMPLRVELLLEDILTHWEVWWLTALFLSLKGSAADIPELLRQGEMGPHAGSSHSSVNSSIIADPQ